MKEIYLQSLKDLRPPKLAIFTLVLFFLFVAFMPIDNHFYSERKKPYSGEFEHFTEHYMRFCNTALQIALPILMRDPVGFMQMINVSAVATLSTYSLKAVLNNRYTIDGTRRLGERPRSPTSRHNMPSGHSNMSALALFFVARRYGFRSIAMFATVAFMLFVLIATMHTRVMLDAHTITATIAGATIGLISALIFTSPRKEQQ